MKEKELELKQEMKRKVELTNKLFETMRDWKNNEAELYKKQMDLRDVSDKLTKKNLEVLKIADYVTLSPRRSR